MPLCWFFIVNDPILVLQVHQINTPVGVKVIEIEKSPVPGYAFHAYYASSPAVREKIRSAASYIHNNSTEDERHGMILIGYETGFLVVTQSDFVAKMREKEQFLFFFPLDEVSPFSNLRLTKGPDNNSQGFKV